MPNSIRPINTAVIPLRSFPRKAGTPALGTDEPGQLTQRQYEPSSADQAEITLHNDIPAELLNLPRVAAGKSQALASYLANQGQLPGGVSDEDQERGSAGAGAESSTEIGRRTAPQAVAMSDKPALAAAGKLPAGVNKASAASTYLANNNEPIYVPVPDLESSRSGQASSLKTLTQNISENVKNAYYRFMTMVPYSVGMLINVFA